MMYYEILKKDTNELVCYAKSHIPVKVEIFCDLIGYDDCYAKVIFEKEYYAANPFQSSVTEL